MSHILPPDADARAETFYRLEPATKKQLLETLRAKDPEEQAATIEAILRQTGAASEFVAHVLGKETSARVPQNKQSNPIHRK